MKQRVANQLFSTVGTVDTDFSTGFYPILVLGENDAVSLYVDESEAVAPITGLAALYTPDVEVLTPEKRLESSNELMVFGRDYDVLVLTNKGGSGQNYIFSKRVPAPDLSITELVTGAELSFSHSFDVPTKIYRTEVYTGVTVPVIFELLAEVNGTLIPTSSTTYIDSSIDLVNGNRYSYYVENAYGVSNVEEVEITLQ